MKKNIFFKLEILILHALKNTDRYGYDLISYIETQTNHYFKLKEGVVYPILRKLLDEQYITSYTEIHNNKARVYYHMTEKGNEKLHALIKDFLQGVKTVEDFLNQ